jgi:hypothetical protein
MTETHRGRYAKRSARSPFVMLLIAAIAGVVVAVGFAPPAFASGPKPSSKVQGATVPLGKVNANAPFASGQVIDVKIPPNSTFRPGAGIKILECGAPHGVLPTDPSACDGLTIQPDTVLAQRDGSVNYTRTATTSGYTVYAVPNYHSLGENKDGSPVCNTTHLCVLYVGQNQLDFTAPHFWSEAFKVSPNATDNGTPPGDGGLSATSGGGGTNGFLTIGLPIVVVVVIGGALLSRRRRQTAPVRTSV